MKAQFYSFLKIAIGLPLTILAFLFIGKILVDQSPVLLPHLKNLDIPLLLYGIFSFLVFYFLRSIIWYRIARQYTKALTFNESCYLWSMSELKRYIPGSIWSFLGRAVLFEKKGMSKKEVGSGLIIEAELFVLGCLILSLLSLPFFLSKSPQFITYAIVIVVAIGTVIYICNKFVAQKLSGKIQAIFHYLLPAFPPLENMKLVLLSALALLFFGLGNYFVMTAAIGTDPQLVWQLVGMFVLAFIIGYLSILTPAGFGVREGITIYTLTKIIPYGLATFIAIFTRIMLILAELLFVLFSYLIFSIKHPLLKKIELWLSHHPYESVVALLSGIYAVYFTTISWLRYDNYYTGRFDLGNMAQTVWNTLHGRIFLFTNPNGTEPISRLAFHADFILVLLAPFYALWEDPRNLLLIQSVVLAMGVFFVFWIAKDVIKNKNIALVFSLAYLLNPSLQRSNLYDFHPVTLATTFLLGTYYFYTKKRYVLFSIFAILAALCKEEVWLIIALFGILVFFHHKKRLIGSIFFAISVGMFYFLFWYAIPQTLGSQHFALAYLSDFGDSPTKIIKGFFTSPLKLLTTFIEPDRLNYLSQLFSPLGYLSIAFPFIIILAAPDLLINVLSNNAQLHQIYYQYTATITPFLFISAIYGVWMIRKIWPKIPSYIFIVYLLATSLYTAYTFGPLPGSKEANIDMITKPIENKAYISNLLQRIPKRYSVSASNNVGSHLSQRQQIYTLPLGIGKADVLVFLLTASEPSNSLKTERKLVQTLIDGESYRLIIKKDDFYVFVRNHEGMR